MIRLDLPLIGPAASVLEAARALAKRHNPLALLIDGNPGGGKSHLCDLLAGEITGSSFAVEQVNGQSVSVDLVRHWRERAGYGNLFSSVSVKRIDELDQASSSAVAELLSFLDYLPRGLVILATTNDHARLRTIGKGRLETRFKRLPVASPQVQEVASYLCAHWRIPKKFALQIAVGSVPEGCLPTEGCNVRAAVADAETWLAVHANMQKKLHILHNPREAA